MNYKQALFAGTLLTAAVAATSGCSKTSSAAGMPIKDKEAVAASSSLKAADGKAVPAMQPAEVSSVLSDAKEVKDIAGGGDLIVKGNMMFNGWFIKADRIIFEPGATLTFSKQAQEKRHQFFLVAKELISKDPSAPGLITWEKGPVQSTGASSGQTPAVKTAERVHRVVAVPKAMPGTVRPL